MPLWFSSGLINASLLRFQQDFRILSGDRQELEAGAVGFAVALFPGLDRFWRDIQVSGEDGL